MLMQQSNTDAVEWKGVWLEQNQEQILKWERGIYTKCEPLRRSPYVTCPRGMCSAHCNYTGCRSLCDSKGPVRE